MKKFLALLLAFCLLGTLCACGKTEEPVEPTEPTEPTESTEPTEPEEPELPLAGGYTVNTETVAGPIPENAKTAFDAAIAGLDGVGYTPVAYLGSQVVSGLNHSYLCLSTPVVPNAEASYSIVKVYADLEGNATVTDIQNLNLLDYVSVEADSAVADLPATNLPGGWTLNQDFGTTLPEGAKTALENAVSGMTGVGYRPVACLGTQVVAGTNYAILAAMTSVTAEPHEGLVVLTVFAGLDGTAQILHVAAI